MSPAIPLFGDKYYFCFAYSTGTILSPLLFLPNIKLNIC